MQSNGDFNKNNEEHSVSFFQYLEDQGIDKKKAGELVKNIEPSPEQQRNLGLAPEISPELAMQVKELGLDGTGMEHEQGFGANLANLHEESKVLTEDQKKQLGEENNIPGMTGGEHVQGSTLGNKAAPEGRNTDASIEQQEVQK